MPQHSLVSFLPSIQSNQRVYDMAGCMGGYGGARMKVFLDKKRLQVSSFKEYMGMFEGMETPVIFEKISDRWEVKHGSVLEDLKRSVIASRT